MKKILAILLINLLICTAPVYASSFTKVPDATLQIAKENGFDEAHVFVPRSRLIRAGIGNENFGTYVYSMISIYGTSDMQIYDNNKLVKIVPANTNVNVKSTNSTYFERLDAGYELSFDNGDEFETLHGPVRFSCNDGLLGVTGLKRAGKPALYRGDFEIAKFDKNRFNLVNIIEVEEYLKGVVPNEMPVRFGLNALKAQTVAARNYALSPRVKASSNYDVVDSVASQVYFGANTEKPLATQAVAETEGVVALYGWDLILAQYSSTAGGYTEDFSLVFSDPVTKEFPSKEKPYLKAKPDMLSQIPLDNEKDAAEFYKSTPDSYDMRSPYFRWEREWTAQELHDALEAALPKQSDAGFVKPVFKKGDKLDDLRELKIKRRGKSGKIVEMEIVTKSQTFNIKKELVIRRLFVKDGKALPSANVVFEFAQDDYGNILSVKAFGGGYGHGVGLSQYGAGFMSEELNMPYEKILQHYYSGITLGTQPVTITHSSDNIVQNFYTTNKETSLIVDNHSSVSKLDVNINGKDVTLDISTPVFGEKILRIDISEYIKNGQNNIVFYPPQDKIRDKYIKLYAELVKKDDNSYN